MSEDKETDKKNLFDFSVFTDSDKYEEFAGMQARHTRSTTGIQLYATVARKKDWKKIKTNK